MRIDAIDIYHVAMPLKTPWRAAYGEDTSVEAVLVKLTSGKHEAWGESTPLAAPCYSPEWTGGVFATVRDWLAPRIIGQDVTSGDDLQQRLSAFKGNPFAKAALDGAWWVLRAEMENIPLYKLLGAKRDSVVVGADFGVADSIAELLEAVGKAVENGFSRVKLKFRPGWDLKMVAAVREKFPDLVMHVDCNGGYTIQDLPLFRQLDAFGLAMIEQPLGYDDLLDHAQLQKELKTAVCLDESINSVRRAEQAISLGSCRWINIKPGRVGGITPALKIHDLAQRAGIPCWVGSMLESAIGSRMCVALAMLDNFTYPADIFPTSRFYHQDVATPSLELSRGSDGLQRVFALQKPGIGTVPDPEQLRRTIRAEAHLHA